MSLVLRPATRADVPVIRELIEGLADYEKLRHECIATDALDVGLDETGALAAADVAGTVLTPLPPAPVEVLPNPNAPAAAPAATPAVAAGPVKACWRYVGAEWRRLPGDVALNACVQALFGGRCERPGGATYGRWGDETLRLVPGRVEASFDNRSFHTVIEQGSSCSIPASRACNGPSKLTSRPSKKICPADFCSTAVT